MSLQKRKIGYWAITFRNKHHEEQNNIFDVEKFNHFMTFLNELSENERLLNDQSQNKAFSFDKVISEKKNGKILIKIIFKSCKYHHSPNYMSSTDGSERKSEKRLDEGDKELTHVSMRLDSDEAFVIVEQRRNGIAMGKIMYYLNRFWGRYLTSDDEYCEYDLAWARVLDDDFIEALNNANRICSAEVWLEKKYVGSEYLNLINLTETAEKEVSIIIKAKRRESLIKESLKSMYYKCISEEDKISRIRLKGKDIDKFDVLIDSMDNKRTKEITVDLKENGIVDSYSIFAKMEELLGIKE